MIWFADKHQKATDLFVWSKNEYVKYTIEWLTICKLRFHESIRYVIFPVIHSLSFFIHGRRSIHLRQLSAANTTTLWTLTYLKKIKSKNHQPSKKRKVNFNSISNTWLHYKTEEMRTWTEEDLTWDINSWTMTLLAFRTVILDGGKRSVSPDLPSFFLFFCSVSFFGKGCAWMIDHTSIPITR